MERRMSEYSLVIHRVRNLGDVIQTIALSRHLPPARGVFRHRLNQADEHRLLVFNGLLDKDTPPKEGVKSLFAGVSGPHFRRKEYLRWMARSPYPIGARDPFTLRQMQSEGLRSVLIGCATLTLPRYDGPRSGVYSVDCTGPGQPLTHRISRRDSLPEQWDRATEILAKYRTAEAVYTSRLHVALPCLAYGTPVWIANPAHGAWQPCRFGLLEELGLPYETLVTADVSPWARRYLEFLQTHLEQCIEPGEPQMPLAPAMESRWPPRWWRW
jgi:hypothetical protein